MGVATQFPGLACGDAADGRPIEGVRQHERKHPARIDLNEKEIALLELLRAPEIYDEVGWDALVRKVRGAARSGEVRVD